MQPGADRQRHDGEHDHAFAGAEQGGGDGRTGDQQGVEPGLAAQEVAPQRIRVNAIAPGAIRTGINTEAWETEAAMGSLLKLIPYGRIGEPDDIGKAAVWLASDDSDYVIGATLFVDGGMTLYPEFASGG